MNVGESRSRTRRSMPDAVSALKFRAAEIEKAKLSEREAAFQELTSRRRRAAASEPEGEVAELARRSIEMKPASRAIETSKLRKRRRKHRKPPQPAAPAHRQLTAQVREQGGRYRRIACRGACVARCAAGRRWRGYAIDSSKNGGRSRRQRRATGTRRRRPEPIARRRPARTSAPAPSISDLLKEGQEIIVQIAKEPLGQKGARITSHIALPGRYVVYMPTLEHMGVSRKIASDEERLRLKRILQGHHAGVRRAASSSARPAKAAPRKKSPPT